MSVAGRTDSREEIINQLIACYEKDLLRLCYVSLGDAALAEDAVQETFWKAYRHWSTFRGGSSEKTWLIRIAINVCRDMARKGWFRMARATVALEGAALSQPEEGRETHTALMAEILALPQPCREVVLLHYYEGFSQTEIARMQHVSGTTVRRRLEKAYSLLKSMLDEGGGDDA